MTYLSPLSALDATAVHRAHFSSSPYLHTLAIDPLEERVLCCFRVWMSA